MFLPITSADDSRTGSKIFEMWPTLPRPMSNPLPRIATCPHVACDEKRSRAYRSHTLWPMQWIRFSAYSVLSQFLDGHSWTGRTGLTEDGSFSRSLGSATSVSHFGQSQTRPEVMYTQV